MFSMPHIYMNLPHPATHSAFTCPASKTHAFLPSSALKPKPAGDGPFSPEVVIPGESIMTESSAASQNEAAQPATRISSSNPFPTLNLDDSATPRPPIAKDAKSTAISFDNFATEMRFHRLQKNRVNILKQQQRTLQRALALSARLSRTVSQVQDGLVEMLKNGDKAGFANAYHATLDLKDTCSSLWNRGPKSFDPAAEDRTNLSSREPDSFTFMDKLPAGSQADVLDFVHLLRTNSLFMVDRIKRLSPTQISALASYPKKHIPRDSLFSMARGTSQTSQQKRNAAYASSLRETILSLERTAPVSALLFNLYSPVPAPHSNDSLIRLDTWSSTCADLYSHSDQAYHYLLIEVLNAFASLHEWGAKSRIDLFLMNLLQTGAFLLEPVEDNLASIDFPFPVSDPLRTQEAEDFFENAVQELFAIISDRDGGLPFGALHFGSAVLGKLGETRTQSSFRGFLLYTWYFSDFLFSALTMPETKGMLLQYHISKGARESILKEVAIRVQSRVAEFLDPTLNPSPLSPTMRIQLEEMVSCLIEVQVERPTRVPLPGEDSRSPPVMQPSNCLVLSVSDILLLIDLLVPQPPPTPTPWDPFMNSSATAFAAQYRQGLPPLSRLFSAEQSHTPGLASSSLPISQSSAAALVRKFEQVRHDLHAVMDRKDVYPVPHPGQDSWTVLELNSIGYPTVGPLLGIASNSSITSNASNLSSKLGRFPQLSQLHLDTAQKASLTLIDEPDGLMASCRFNRGMDEMSRTNVSLERLFAVKLEIAEDSSDIISAQYWWTALKALRAYYPLSVLAQNDSRILQPILLTSRQSHSIIQQQTQLSEAALRNLEDAYDRMSATITDTLGNLSRLRDKIWYLVDITNSSVYEVTRNVARALRNMASPASPLSQSSSASIRGRKKPRSLAESILQEPEAQTTSLMKAPLEQGGPRKLADEQVDMTRRWFQRFNVDNFCKGEERIHRFCMEIRMAASRLVGESMIESPVLWSSELYFRQRTPVDGLVTRSVPGSSVTRPSSILSEEGSNSCTQTFQSSRGFESFARPPFSDSQSPPRRKNSVHSLGSDRWRTTRDLHGIDVLSLADSPGRAVSATTAESINSVWSTLPTQPQSAASVSSYPSRPPSFLYENSSPRPADQSSSQRVKFLEELRQRVVSLLLSDLGSPVWSCGSETDTWLAEMLRHDPVRSQMEKRESMERLFGDRRESGPGDAQGSAKAKIGLRGRRSIPSGLNTAGAPSGLFQSSPSINNGRLESPPSARVDVLPQQFSYEAGYEDLMRQFSRQADPLLKLDILRDLRSLTISAMQRDHGNDQFSGTETLRAMPNGGVSVRSAPSSRRSSMTRAWLPGSLPSQQKVLGDGQEDMDGEQTLAADGSIDEKGVVNELKLVFMSTRPKTLFRDLQFITAFVPSDVLNKTPGGKAFLDVALAALAFKDDVCRSLVTVADRISVRDGVKRTAAPAGTIEYSLRDAAQMWILAAKEGNATAQRELAALYLNNSELLPSVSLPLTAPRDIFKSEMKYWPESASKGLSTQAMCLALHWMQLAANNGDAIAQKRLKDREAKDSIR